MIIKKKYALQQTVSFKNNYKAWMLFRQVFMNIAPSDKKELQKMPMGEKFKFDGHHARLKCGTLHLTN